MALLVQKLWGGKKLSKSFFGYYKTKKKKVPTDICQLTFSNNFFLCEVYWMGLRVRTLGTQELARQTFFTP